MIYPDLRLRLISPVKYDFEYLANFVKSKQKWIEKHIEKFQIRQENTQFSHETQFYFLGKAYEKIIIKSDKIYSEIKNNQYRIYTNDPLNKELQLIIENEYLASKAKEVFEPILDNYLQILKPYNLTLKDIKLASLKSKWGSCLKSKKKITLNIKLLHEDIRFIEYVILHELSHLKYANHSKQFYDFLALFMPDWKERKKLVINY
jgi:hypothetical protein